MMSFLLRRSQLGNLTGTDLCSLGRKSDRGLDNHVLPI
jgi:hypothetical protein